MGVMDAVDEDTSDVHTAFKLDTPQNGYFVNGSDCTAKTYTGTYDATTGKITYGDDSATSPITSFSAANVKTGDAFYFKTVISNSSQAKTNVSLFVNIKYNQYFGTDLKLGVSSPVIRESTFTTGSQPEDGYISLKLQPVVRAYEGPESGTVNIEWYIYSTDNDVGDFELQNIILTTN